MVRTVHAGRFWDGRSDTLQRDVDYRIDYPAGWIELAAPLPSVAPPAALVTGDPLAAAEAVLHVDYLHASATGEADDLAGGRAGAAIGPLQLSVQGAREDRSGAGYRIAAGL